MGYVGFELNLPREDRLAREVLRAQIFFNTDNVTIALQKKWLMSRISIFLPFLTQDAAASYQAVALRGDSAFVH